ncbi:hypothetical protein ACFL2F_00840 [Myxococcota bacterium]
MVLTQNISPLVYNTQAVALRSTDMEKGVAGFPQLGQEDPAGQLRLPMEWNWLPPAGSKLNSW